MPSSFVKHLALALVLLGPAILAAGLLFARYAPPELEPVIRCDESVRRGKPLLQLNEAQCQSIGRAVPVIDHAVSSENNVEVETPQRKLIEAGDPPPAQVDLQALPKDVAEAHPDLARLKYFLIEDEIALVDPGRNEVVAFVEVHRSKEIPEKNHAGDAVTK